MRLVLALIIVSIGLSAFADETTPLKSLVEEALEKNPEILRAKAEWEAATKRPSQAGSLPDPIVGVGWRNVRFDRITLTEDPNSMVTFSLSQEFPFPGKLSLREKVAQEEAQAQEKLYEATLRRVIADLKEAYYNWFLVDKSIEITLKNKDLLEKFLKVAEAKYAVGKGIQQDVLKAQVEVSRFIEQLQLLEERRGIVEARIRSILNRPPDSPLVKPEVVEKSPFILTAEELYKLTKEKAPLLKVKENLIDRQEEALKLAKREYYPDFALGVAPAVMGMESGGVEGAWEVTLGVKVPLYFYRKQRFGVQEAVSQLQAAREDYTSTNQSLFFNVKDQYLVAKTSENLLKLFQEGIIPQAASSLESAITGYQVGNIDFLTLLNNLVTLFNFEITYYTYLTNYQTALARIEEVVDMPLIK
ncbi:MAG: outer membrane efflux protein [Candidatus Dadabacteria bacterium CSP1-2]|jgi:outer membrane protein TolC|nr:MAG: outer membrane efflux protein [Candidatus Dadabacteria bacterium CSP1-2]